MNALDPSAFCPRKTLVCLLTVAASCSAVARNSSADVVTVTYEMTSSDFLDSNSNPPVFPASNAVDGIYTFTFDTDGPVMQDNIVPNSVVGLDITDSNGMTTDYNETNSGVNAYVNIFADEARITVGAHPTGIEGMTGITNDFRFVFEISLIDFEVLSVVENMTYVTVTDPFYIAQNTTVQLLGVTVPEPNLGLILLACSICFVTLARVRGRTGKPLVCHTVSLLCIP